MGFTAGGLSRVNHGTLFLVICGVLLLCVPEVASSSRLMADKVESDVERKTATVEMDERAKAVLAAATLLGMATTIPRRTTAILLATLLVPPLLGVTTVALEAAAREETKTSIMEWMMGRGDSSNMHMIISTSWVNLFIRNIMNIIFMIMTIYFLIPVLLAASLLVRKHDEMNMNRHVMAESS
uniref:Uncharacterized protein n=1 Tax=Kalanchoe fedtschenkoi TaxID=63787 RepID=A0A7N0UQN0_KALFE